MPDCMTFPDTVEEFMEQYKVVDTEQVYSNGIEFVPIFRMRQWFQHKPERKRGGKWILDNSRLRGNRYICDQCGYETDTSWNPPGNFCPNCGAEMRTPVETARDIVHTAIDNSVWSDTVDTAKMHKIVDDKYAEMEGQDDRK